MGRIIAAATGIILLAAGAQPSFAADMLDPARATFYDYYSLWERYHPGWAEENIDAILHGPLCDLRETSANEFVLHDKVKEAIDKIKSGARKGTTMIGPITIKIPLGKYDFGRQGFPVEFPSDADGIQIGDLADDSNRGCWSSVDTKHDFTALYYKPWHSSTASFLPLSEADARAIVGERSGGLIGEMTFSLHFDGRSSKPLPYLTISGAYDHASLKILASSGELLKDFGPVIIKSQVFEVNSGRPSKTEEDIIVRVVNEYGEKSGVWRADPTRNEKRYYLIVESVTESGQVIPQYITNEEDGTKTQIKKWGQRVSESVYNSVADDKIDNGKVDNDLVGYVRYGADNICTFLEVEDRAITKW